MDLGLFSIDTQPMLDFFTQPVASVVWQLFGILGWVALDYLLLYAGLELYQKYRQDKHTAHWKWIVLAVDVPALNLQTPKAVEQMFNHLAGAHEHGDITEHFRGGHKQRWFSFEIISIEGYIQFLIRTEEGFRDLVEAALYAQYPDAEVVEVEDYVASAPDHFPNAEYDMWAADFTLSENDAFPIRTYREFEHNISKDTQLKDPMGAFLESFSRIGPGEQVWFQILLEPTSNSWKEKAIKQIKEVIGETRSHATGSPTIQAIGNAPAQLLQLINTEVFGAVPGEGAHEEREGPPNQIQYLTPGQSKMVEAMELKISHIGFKTKLRAVYLARKEVFRKERAVHAIIGAMNQYNIPSANSLVPSFTSNTSYFFKKERSAHRKSLLMKAYKKRKLKIGSNSFILNVEELATIWHFPMSHIKTPLLQKAQGKRAEPPAGLPVEHLLSPFAEAIKEAPSKPNVDLGSYPEGMKFG